MFRGLSISVVIPAFNEERAILGAIAAVPAFVDQIIVVDDGSHDATLKVAAGAGGQRVEILTHGQNRGVGGAIVTGYRRSLALGYDVVVVMAGDGQMDPADLPALLEPIAAGRADYAKGNRFRHREVWRVMPRSRIAGNIALSLATKVTSGHWRLFDSQCGYTAISRRALEAIDLHRIFPRYGPNDLLARLRTAEMRVVDVPVRPIYGDAWRSGISLATAFYPVAWVLLRSWGQRWLAGAARRRAAGSEAERVYAHRPDNHVVSAVRR